MLDQKVNSSNFLQFKMAHKAAETTHNINNAFGPGTAKQGTVVVQEVLQSRQEPWSWGAQWPYTESLQRPRQEPLQKLILLQLHKKLSKNSILAFNLQCHSTASWHLKQIGKVKRLNKWVPYELTEKSKKIIALKCHHLLFYSTVNYFSIKLWSVTKSGFYTTVGDDQLNDWTKKFLQSPSQSQTCTK